eukprot:TRINITY_DN229_c0_g1_i1.p1 TRINITY_DN229_c0_g1~~TRINITY_DN229_c0_g1_i1.p1  ORF type:complete len:483 (-),score=146.66 TRINITY_DN229_c0_g1_i1:235-1683(-)
MKARWFLIPLLVAVILPLTLSEGCSKDDFFPCSESFTGNLTLMILYGIILAFGAKTISDGSELLLRILDPGVIGGFVLPLLGAVPDTAMIALSGMGSDAQNQVSVGVGTLAGSTVMLLTLSWAASMLVARCDLDENGRSIDGTFTKKKSWTGTGVTVADETPTNSILMMVTSLSYLIIQGVAFNYIGDDDSHSAKTHEKGFALATLIVCAIMFVVYSVFQVLNTKLQQRRIEQAKEDARREEMQSHWNMVVTLAMIRGRGGKPNEGTSLLGVTNPGEEAHEPKSDMDVSRFFGKWKKKALEPEDPKNVEGEEEEEEEDDGLTRGQIAVKSAVMLFIGVGLVCFFSDPMVDVISRIGDEINVNAFYVSFVVTPVCSNASELISSLVFASKKSQKSSTITFCQLLGAACMNNTLGLGVLVALVYFRNLAWWFSAETLCILVTVFGVGVIALKKTYKSISLFFIGALYFVAIGVVVFFENVFHWH